MIWSRLNWSCYYSSWTFTLFLYETKKLLVRHKTINIIKGGAGNAVLRHLGRFEAALFSIRARLKRENSRKILFSFQLLSQNQKKYRPTSVTYVSHIEILAGALTFDVTVVTHRNVAKSTEAEKKTIFKQIYYI